MNRSLSDQAVIAEDVVKTFKGGVRALDGVSLRCNAGTVLGLLGPNGAGKTTVVPILTTLLRADSGRAEVDGVDVLRNPAEARRRIGLAGQFAAVDANLTGRENLMLVGKLNHLPKADAKARAGELLEQFGIAEAGDRLAKTYSGGMRRRLDLAAALVARPPVLFLDEPTTGLDPRQPDRPVAGDRGSGRRRYDAAADHAVPRGGRPAGQPHLRHRPRPGHRRGHLGASSRPGSARRWSRCGCPTSRRPSRPSRR